MTRVLVVDDSAFVRTVVGDALVDAGYSVETAATGETAVSLADSFDPDVITMDVEMPGIDGIEAVERIMSANPTAILMLSAHTATGATATMDALERGALDVVRKPDGSDGRNVAHLVDDVLDAVDDLAAADVSTLALARTSAAAHAANDRRAIPAHAGRQRRRDADERQPIRVPTDATLEANPTVVVGASTGGPRIVERLLADLPPELDLRGVIVQHMPATFTDRFAARLNEVSAYDISEASDGDRLHGGELLVAPGDRHIVVEPGNRRGPRVRLRDDDPVNGVRPSIDVTMESAAEAVTGPLAALVLTGMGRDGADGVRAVAEAGGRTIVQDEATSPVFGMPRQAVATGDVDAVVPADRLARRLVTTFTDETPDSDGVAESPAGGGRRG